MTIDRRDRVAQMEHHTVRLVQRLYEPTQLDAHHALERYLLGCHHLDCDVTVSERGRYFESDEARAGYDDPLCLLRRLHDRLAVRERTQVVDVRCICTRYRQFDRVGACGNQQRAEWTPRSVFEQHLAPGDINR